MKSPVDALIIDLTTSTIWMMGVSFILGSLFTILILIILDFMRRRSESE